MALSEEKLATIQWRIRRHLLAPSVERRPAYHRLSTHCRAIRFRPRRHDRILLASRPAAGPLARSLFIKHTHTALPGYYAIPAYRSEKSYFVISEQRVRCCPARNKTRDAIPPGRISPELFLRPRAIVLFLPIRRSAGLFDKRTFFTRACVVSPVYRIIVFAS